MVESQKIEHQERFLGKLQSAISEINQTYENEIVAPFTTIKGVDEIGGVLESISPIADINRIFSRKLHPKQVRLAAVVDEIDAGMDSMDVTQMSGSGFSRADLLLSDIEDEGLTFVLSGTDELLDEFVSDEINLLDIVRSNWSKRKMEVVSVYDEVENQKDAAERLGITKQAVSKHLRSNQTQNVLLIEKRLNERLKDYPYSNYERNSFGSYSL